MDPAMIIKIILAPLYLYSDFMTLMYEELRGLAQVYHITSDHVVAAYKAQNALLRCEYETDLAYWHEITEISESVYTYYEQNTTLPSPYTLSLQNSRYYPRPKLEDYILAEDPEEIAIAHLYACIVLTVSIVMVLIARLMQP